MKELNWEQYFTAITKVTAMKSHDPNTKVGAIIVNENKRIVSTGFNGMPQGDDDFPWEREAKESKNTKYPYVIHAELNAILNATSDIQGSTMYVTLFPCSSCAKLIAQANIKEFYYLDNKYEGTDDDNISKIILDKLKIKYIKIKNLNIEIK